MPILVLQGHVKDMMTGVANLLKTNNVAKCTLIAEGQSIDAHKIILSACSPYFQSLFRNEVCNNFEVDVKFQDLKYIIDLIYQGSLEVPDDDMQSLLSAADTLKLSRVIEISKDSVNISHPSSSESEVVHKLEILGNELPSNSSSCSLIPHDEPSQSVFAASTDEAGKNQMENVFDANMSANNTIIQRVESLQSNELDYHSEVWPKHLVVGRKNYYIRLINENYSEYCSQAWKSYVSTDMSQQTTPKPSNVTETEDNNFSRDQKESPLLSNDKRERSIELSEPLPLVCIQGENKNRGRTENFTSKLLEAMDLSARSIESTSEQLPLPYDEGICQSLTEEQNNNASSASKYCQTEKLFEVSGQPYLKRKQMHTLPDNQQQKRKRETFSQGSQTMFHTNDLDDDSGEQTTIQTTDSEEDLEEQSTERIIAASGLERDYHHTNASSSILDLSMSPVQSHSNVINFTPSHLTQIFTPSFLREIIPGLPSNIVSVRSSGVGVTACSNQTALSSMSRQMGMLGLSNNDRKLPKQGEFVCSNSTLVQTGQIQAAQAQAAQMQTAQMQAEQMQAAQMQAAQMQAAQMQAAQMQAAQIQTPHMQTPQIQAPQIQAPQIQTPQIQTPQIQVSQIQTPQIQAPQILTPQVQAPQIQTPQVQAPQIQTPQIQAAQMQAAHIQAAGMPICIKTNNGSSAFQERNNNPNLWRSLEEKYLRNIMNPNVPNQNSGTVSSHSQTILYPSGLLEKKVTFVSKPESSLFSTSEQTFIQPSGQRRDINPLTFANDPVSCSSSLPTEQHISSTSRSSENIGPTTKRSHGSVPSIYLNPGERPCGYKDCESKFFACIEHMNNRTRPGDEERRIVTAVTIPSVNVSSNQYQGTLHDRPSSSHHSQGAHPDRPSFTCHICKKSFLHRDHLHTHLRHHITNPYFKCNICNKRFSFEANLKYHLLVHKK